MGWVSERVVAADDVKLDACRGPLPKELPSSNENDLRGPLKSKFAQSNDLLLTFLNKCSCCICIAAETRCTAKPLSAYLTGIAAA